MLKPVLGVLNLRFRDVQVVGGAGVPTVIWETHRDMADSDLTYRNLTGQG